MFLSCLQNSPWLISNATVPQSKSNSLLSARSCSSATTTDPCSAVCMTPGQEQGNITWNAKQHDFSHSKPCKKLASHSNMFCFCTAKKKQGVQSHKCGKLYPTSGTAKGKHTKSGRFVMLCTWGRFSLAMTPRCLGWKMLKAPPWVCIARGHRLEAPDQSCFCCLLVF